MTNKPTDHRVCAVCGESKPLFAFVQMREGEKDYGIVCSTCRAAGKDVEQESGEEVRSTLKKRIDSKSKVAEEIHHRLTLKLTREQEADERFHKEELELEERTKKEDVQKKQFTHRMSFLNQPPKKEGEVRSSDVVRRQVVTERAVKEQNQRKFNETELHKKNEVDFSTTFSNPQYGNEERFKSSDYRKYLSWLGGAAPVVQQEKTNKKEVERIKQFVDEEFKPNKPGRRR